MKRGILIILIVLLMMGAAFGSEALLPSTQTADAAICTGRCYLGAIIVMPDGTNDVTVSIYDNTTNSGTEMLPTMTFAGDGGAQAFAAPYKILGSTGIYVDITTEGTVEYTILYNER
jgi:hypothetical protein